MSSDHLSRALESIEHEHAGRGWDQPPVIYALVPTATVEASEPQVAAALGLDSSRSYFTPFEQEPLDPDLDLGQFLAGIAWPDEVAGAALVLERTMLPPEARDEVEAAADPAAAAEAHPLREDVRMIVGVSREHGDWCMLRMRRADDDASVLVGPDLVPELIIALRATFDAESG